MKRTIALLAVMALCAVCSAVYAVYGLKNEGTWPKSWPKELEPLRRSSRTYVGGNDVSRPGENYVIPFTNQKDFEAAWPHILKVKSKGAPLLLVRPNTWMNEIDAGRPVLVTWRYWTLDGPTNVGGINYYTWHWPPGAGGSTNRW